MSKPTLFISHTDDGMELSREEFAEADFEKPWRYERAKGRLVVMVPPGHDHHATVEPIRDYLGAYRLANPHIVQHVFQESWTAVEEDTDRLPDIAVYLTSSAGRIPERVPELIFEIVSPSPADRRRDYVDKREEFERIGVLEYVIVDRFERKFTVLRLTDGKHVDSTLAPGDTYTTPLLPGLAVPLAKVI
jgi:Uma2 family endonuclease